MKGVFETGVSSRHGENGVRALVKSQKGPGFFSLGDWREPKAGPGRVLIRVEYAGVCGTDLSIVAGRWRCNPPVVLGHEYSGTVAEIGEGVTRVKKGDAVVVSNPARTCGSCFHCRVGNPFMCDQLVSRGYTVDGGFAELIAVEEPSVWRIPSGLSLRDAVLCEPLAGVLHAMTERVSLHSGDTVLISGPGGTEKSIPLADRVRANPAHFEKLLLGEDHLFPTEPDR